MSEMTSARDAAGQATEQAQEKVQQATGQAQDKLRAQLDQRTTQLADEASRQASDLRSTSEALRDQGKDRPAQLTARLADYAEQAARYLEHKDADSILADAEDFGRQKPAAVAASAVALGFAASRFLKASSGRRYSTRQDVSRTPAPSAVPASEPPRFSA